MPRLGKTIRRLRLARGMTLQDLAGTSGVSVGMLSQIERDMANPSLRVLSQVRDALGASMGELFAEQPGEPADPPFVCRAANRPRLAFGLLRKELLAHSKPGHLQLMVLILPPGASSGELTTPHEKAGLVLEGSAVLAVRGEAAVLQAGDSFLFDGADIHSLRNPGPATCRVLWVMAAPRVERHL